MPIDIIIRYARKRADAGYAVLPAVATVPVVCVILLYAPYLQLFLLP